MLLTIIQAILGLILLNISFKSLKKSVIRKWRQSFAINFIVGALVIVFAIISIFFEMPLIINNIFMFLVFSSMTFSMILISKMNGLDY